MKFYLTFGQNSPMKDGWIEVIADNEYLARLKVVSEYGQKWSGLYNEFNFEKEDFPEGKLGELK